MWNVYLPLLGYKHVNGPDGATLVPYLAQDMPTVSADGKTYTLTLRKGLKYSDGTPIKASDFAATIERDYKVDSPGVGFFGEHRRRRHVRQDEDGSHQRHHHRRRDRQDHDQAELAAGRLRVHPRDRVRGARARELAGQGHVDEPAAVDRPVHDQELRAEQVGDRRPQPELRRERLRRQRAGRQPGQDDDRHHRRRHGGTAADDQRPGRLRLPPVPPDRLARLQQKYGDQIKVYTPANTYYFFMNNRVAPFDNLKVRQAVNYAINREALVRIYGGLGRRRRTCFRRRIRSTRSSTCTRTTSRRRSS